MIGRSRHPSSRIVPSILDRLIDEHPDRERDRPRSPSEMLSDLRASIHRDLEALLNARRPWRHQGEAWPGLCSSPAGYGISDLTAGRFNDEEGREALRLEIETAIRRFEPRLTAVEVQVSTPDAPLSATLALRINAVLLVEPQPEPVSFDTVVEAATANVVIRPMRDA